MAPDADSTALAADLVAEAVATYQEQQGELEPPEWSELEVPIGDVPVPAFGKSPGRGR